LFEQVPVSCWQRKKTQKSFQLKSENKQQHLISPFLYYIVLEVPVNSVRYENEMAGINFGKTELQVALLLVLKCILKNHLQFLKCNKKW